MKDQKLLQRVKTKTLQAQKLHRLQSDSAPPLFAGPKAYIAVVKKFKKACEGIKPQKLTAAHAEKYISNMTKSGKCSVPKHRMAAAALNYYYRHCLGIPLKLKIPYRPRPIPTVLSKQQICKLIEKIPTRHQCAFWLLHGFGLKIGQVLKLRIKNIDINNGVLHLDKKRQFKLHAYLVDKLLNHLALRRKQFHADAKKGRCYIRHNNGFIVDDFQNQPLFVSRQTKLIDGQKRARSFIHPSTFHRVLRKVYQQSGIAKLCSCMVLRHSFAVAQLESQCNIIELKFILGHKDIHTTLNYKRCLSTPVISPLEELQRPARKNSNYLSRYAATVKNQAAACPPEAAIYLKNTLNDIKTKKINGVFCFSKEEKWRLQMKTAYEKQQNFRVFRASEKADFFPGLHPDCFLQADQRPD